MKSSNLVAKVITDKNGVKTTRWVKPDKEQKTIANTVPVVTAVPLVSLAERERMISDLSHQFLTWCDPHSVNIDGALAAISKWDSRTLSALVSDLGDTPEDKIDTATIWIDIYPDKENYLRELFTFHSAFDPSTDHSFVEEAIFYLHKCEELPQVDDYSTVSPEMQQTIRNLLSVTETYIAEEYEFNRDGNDPILPPEVRAVVIERPDSTERINAILLDDPDTDAERIKMMLDSDAPSIAEGML